MKSILELLIELVPLDAIEFARRFSVPDDPNGGSVGQRIDFENWLRNSARRERRFDSLEDAYEEYLKSFG